MTTHAYGQETLTIFCQRASLVEAHQGHGVVYASTHVFKFSVNTILAWIIKFYDEEGNVIITTLLLPLGHISNSITNLSQTKAFTPELEPRCSGNTTINVAHVLSPLLFHDHISYMQCGTATTAQQPIRVRSASIFYISTLKSTTGSRRRNPHEDLSMSSQFETRLSPQAKVFTKWTTPTMCLHHKASAFLHDHSGHDMTVAPLTVMGTSSANSCKIWSDATNHQGKRQQPQAKPSSVDDLMDENHDQVCIYDHQGHHEKGSRHQI